MSSSPRAAALALALLGLAGCDDDAEVNPVGTTESIYVTPSSLSELSGETFFDHPWPSDLRLEGGSPRFEGYYNPRELAILDEYVGYMKGLLDGFSPAGAGFLRFTAGIDPASLPATPTAGLAKTSSVQLIDVDPASPERGSRKLASLYWRGPEGVYWRPNTLSFMPTFGFPLRTHTKYALVVTDALRAADGTTIRPSDDLAQTLKDPASPVAPAIAEVAAAGVAPGKIIHLAVFTTNDPTEELFAVGDDVAKSIAPPTFKPDAWKIEGKKPESTEFVGVYGPSPNYQAGKIPFKDYGDGGQFNIVGGKPQVVDLFDLRFSLTVPFESKCPMPPDGYPIVLYAHGTGGDYRSYVRDGTASALAKECLASMGINQIFHGTRPGADQGSPELLFFNFQNIAAGRTGGRQGAIDEIQRARLFTVSHAEVPASISGTGQPIKFDASRLMFFGHSQGGLNGPLYFAADGSARGGILSGSSSVMSITLLEKTKPAPSVASIVQTVFLGLKADEFEEMNPHHPAISLAQSIVDVLDPIHYAAFTVLAPRPGLVPKSVYMTEGINPDGTGDSYAPPHGIEAHGIAMGLPLQRPDVRDIIESEFGGPQPVDIPPEGLAGDLASGAASGVLAQWQVPADSDGHFVVFDVPEARAQSSKFLRFLADEPAGRVPPP